MKKSIKNLAFATIALVAVLTMSSCGRGGYGCPYELKVPTPSLINIIK